MGRKKREVLVMRPFCYYCEKEFEEETILLSHQKIRHFGCTLCKRTFSTANSMAAHMLQVHKETLTRVPNAKTGRETLDVQVYGMQGVPEAVIEQRLDYLINTKGKGKFQRSDVKVLFGQKSEPYPLLGQGPFDSEQPALAPPMTPLPPMAGPFTVGPPPPLMGPPPPLMAPPMIQKQSNFSELQDLSHSRRPPSLHHHLPPQGMGMGMGMGGKPPPPQFSHHHQMGMPIHHPPPPLIGGPPPPMHLTMQPPLMQPPMPMQPHHHPPHPIAFGFAPPPGHPYDPHMALHQSAEAFNFNNPGLPSSSFDQEIAEGPRGPSEPNQQENIEPQKLDKDAPEFKEQNDAPIEKKPEGLAQQQQQQQQQPQKTEEQPKTEEQIPEDKVPEDKIPEDKVPEQPKPIESEKKEKDDEE